MKTSVMEVPDMLRVLTVDDVEKRFVDVAGVESATVNYAAGKITVRYDETLLSVADIGVLVHQRGQKSEDAPTPADGDESKAELQPPAAAPANAPANAPADTDADTAASTSAEMPADMPADMPMPTAPEEKQLADKSTPAATHSHASS